MVRPMLKDGWAPPGTRRGLQIIAPGIISGAADTDPTTVATLAVVGATTIYGLTWLLVLIFPALAVIQVISARVGMCTRRDLQTSVDKRFGPWPRLLLLTSVFAVTVVTIAADLEGGAAALGLLFHADWRWFVIPLALVLVTLLTIGNYDEVQQVMRYVLFVFLAYVISAFVAHPDWSQVLHHTAIPTFRFNTTYTEGALAIIGTTLTSYVYVWQTIEEAEETAPLEWLRAREAGAGVGILLAVMIFWFILVASGGTLGVHHLPVQTADQAAAALKPVAGAAASYIFGIGLLASAVVALPVLMATCGYIVGAHFDWERGLSKDVRHAPRFYATVVLSMGLGVLISFSGVSPIRILFISGIIGGVATPVGLVFLLLVAADESLMDHWRISGPLLLAGWVVTLLIGVAGVTYVVQQLASG
jgi:Mn2+/Fe2+ NRAMP family transporter